ncbi:unnamed protein product [Eruca vesicaria subsp. sativa]|uniref:Uncharacterized protein n=1 Tax=Eruca vesicaria subsp. sativa TaxID=29727 RepID=A0ABC8L9K7_ERUVS|nr:unnamed protein product [Eruca vesicaria subsp. sativa]
MLTACGCSCQGVVFPFIDPTGNSEVINDADYIREDEKNDERVGRVVDLLNKNQDWTQFTWQLEPKPQNFMLSDEEELDEDEAAPVSPVREPPVDARRGKRKINDPGSESRKKNMLCQRAAEHNSGVSSEMKSFIEGLLTSSFSSLKEVLQKDIQEQFQKVNNEIDHLREQMFHLTGPSDTVGKGEGKAAETPGSGKAVETPGSGKAVETPGSGKASDIPGSSLSAQTMVSPVAKEISKGKQERSKDPPTVRRSPRPGRKVTRK